MLRGSESISLEWGSDLRYRINVESSHCRQPETVTARAGCTQFANKWLAPGDPGLRTPETREDMSMGHAAQGGITTSNTPRQILSGIRADEASIAMWAGRAALDMVTSRIQKNILGRS